MGVIGLTGYWEEGYPLEIEIRNPDF